ncbi:MAG: cellulase family glycosylhydrolase, partial [Chthoniobacterales bacterium]
MRLRFDGTLRVACAFGAIVVIGAASAAAPSGQITANPEVVMIPAGASSGSTSISWTTVNCAAAQVTVTAAGGEEQVFGEATSFQNAVAPWIGLNTFTFRLYGDLTRTLLLDSVVVTGVPAPTGSITAQPMTFTLPAGDATFSTTLAWTTSGGLGGWVTRSVPGGGEQLIAQGGSNGSFVVSGLGAGETIFRLYGDEARTLLLGSVLVTGVPPLPGSITASPSTFTLGTNATVSTALSWMMDEGSVGWVTQSTAGGSEQLVAQGGTTVGFEVSGLGAGRTVFRLYGDEARTQLLDSMEVIGTASPLTVQADGTLRLDNRRFTGVGVNYYSAFGRVLENASDASYDAGFAALGRWGVPFARLDISGYWPSKANLFFTNRTEYFRRLDGLVASAERHGVGLIPSLFWTTFTFADLAGEHLDQLAVSNSVTRQKMREFATEIVNRYKHSRAIWAWEFGNEWSLAVDLPNGTEFLPPTWTNLGNPATRDSVRDVLATDTILPAMREFADLVRELDPGRPISTGHAMSRPSQWHQDQWKRGLLPIGSAWTTDSVAQAEEIALRQCPDPYDLLSVHIYGDDPQRIPNFATFAARAGKALFAGEFGMPNADQNNYATMLSAIRAYSPLAAVWVFDRSVDDYNITT